MKIRKEDKWNDTAQVIHLTRMGRGILKMSNKLGVVKVAEDSQPPPANDGAD